ncbi:LysR substrate-binding domain-containing protein [Variovorax sp.]|jgi:LysR family glycine cleavage system transcriptional activator|uniref:LysR substrate-binding domain-containing protein n=1 Tax=Variovorax sp. TaxID=1871043 RepID=UPI0037DA1E18
MSRKLPPLNAIRAFEAAGRHVSFTRAAEELSVTNGAISRQVALLEEWLGVPLFRRTSSQLALTEAGRLYLGELTATLDRVAVASMQLREQAVPTALRINAPPTFTMRWLLSRLPAFQRRRPEVDLRLTTLLAPVNFDEGRYDIAIAGALEPPPHCVSRPFMSELILPVCHVDLLDGGRLREPRDLAVHTLVSFATEPYAWEDWLAAAGVAGLKPGGAIRFEQMYFALQAAIDGLGLALVPLFLAFDDIIAGRLCAPFGVLAAKQRRYFASTAHADPVTESFCEWLVREGSDTEASMQQWLRSQAPAS